MLAIIIGVVENNDKAEGQVPGNMFFHCYGHVQFPLFWQASCYCITDYTQFKKVFKWSTFLENLKAIGLGFNS